MKQIVVGLLKSTNHPVKLKKALLNKLCQTGDVVKAVNLNELIAEIEKVFRIEAWDEINTSLDQSSLIDELKASYDNLTEHFDLLKELFNSYAQFSE